MADTFILQVDIQGNSGSVVSASTAAADALQNVARAETAVSTASSAAATGLSSVARSADDVTRAGNAAAGSATTLSNGLNQTRQSALQTGIGLTAAAMAAQRAGQAFATMPGPAGQAGQAVSQVAGSTLNMAAALKLLGASGGVTVFGAIAAGAIAAIPVVTDLTMKLIEMTGWLSKGATEAREFVNSIDNSGMPQITAALNAAIARGYTGAAWADGTHTTGFGNVGSPGGATWEQLTGSPLPEMRASGGPVAAGAAYVVGEKRAELFVPDRPGTILPSLAGLGGTTNHFTFHINTGGGAVDHGFEDRVVAAITNAQRRGRL